MSGVKFQIRTDYHSEGALWIRENSDKELVLENGEGTVMNLGEAEDALLVAKCIEVSTRWEVSDEFAELTREKLQETLEQVKANHELIESQNHE